MRALLLSLVAVALFAGPLEAKTSQEQKEWMAKRDAQPLDFNVAEADSAAAWARAKEWVARFAPLPIQHADELVIQTIAAPDEADARPQLTVTRTQLPSGEWVFRVSGVVYNIFANGSLQRTARALAYYTASGIPYPPDAPKKRR